MNDPNKFRFQHEWNLRVQLLTDVPGMRTGYIVDQCKYCGLFGLRPDSGPQRMVPHGSRLYVWKGRFKMPGTWMRIAPVCSKVKDGLPVDHDDRKSPRDTRNQ